MPTQYSGGMACVNPSSRNAADYSVLIYNGYTDFKIHPNSPSPKGGARGDRKAIKTFSSRSRKNLLKNIFSVSTYPSLFVTLTYPRFYPAEAKEWKRHLDNFFHSLKRHFPKSWFFWKLEPQKRGAPHYHLIGSIGEDINVNALRELVARLWYRVCKTGDERHLKAGTQVDFINDSLGKMRGYVCKYVGKATRCEYEQWARPGRFWGIKGRENLPAIKATYVDIGRDDFYKLKRLAKKWLKRLSPSSKGYARRLAKNLSSFFILAHHTLIWKMLESAVGFAVSTPQSFSPVGYLDLGEPPF